MARKKPTFDKRVVISGVLVAFSVVIMFLGCYIEVFDLALSAIVSLIIVIVVIEMGFPYAWLTYVATAILSLLLLPNRSPAVFYTFFLGYYPIIKSYVERLGSAVLRWVIKLAAGNVALALMFAFMKLFLPEEFEGGWMLVITYIVGLVAFITYDIALSKLITLYFARIRDRLRLDRYLK